MNIDKNTFITEVKNLCELLIYDILMEEEIDINNTTFHKTNNTYMVDNVHYSELTRELRNMVFSASDFYEINEYVSNFDFTNLQYDKIVVTLFDQEYKFTKASSNLNYLLNEYIKV